MGNWKRFFQSNVTPPAPNLKGASPTADQPKFFSLNELDKKLQKYLAKKDGFYVELGANNGIDQSNTMHYELEWGWRGILIEAIPHMYLKCLENRGANNQIFCAACVPDGYSKEFVRMIYSNLMTVSSDLDLDVDDPHAHAARGLQFLPHHERNLVFGALARTLTSILDEANAPKTIDLLSLDVEGGELDVLKGVDLQKYRFNYMIIEGRNVERLQEYLTSRGYKLIDQLSDQDYLFSPMKHDGEKLWKLAWKS